MSNRYGIKAIFNTLQGEGARAGQRSVFVRFSGCNLWNGHPLHRDAGLGPCARWCDTDFFKGTPMDIETILAEMDKAWPVSDITTEAAMTGREANARWCVLTGGEPALQIDRPLVDALHAAGWCIAVETNGTVACPALTKCDHICVSPKRGTALVISSADELKVVVPGAVEGEQGWEDAELQALASAGVWGRRYVQAQDVVLAQDVVDISALRANCDEPGIASIGQHLLTRHMQRAMNFVMSNPGWGLSVQMHKLLGLE